MYSYICMDLSSLSFTDINAHSYVCFKTINSDCLANYNIDAHARIRTHARKQANAWIHAVKVIICK